MDVIYLAILVMLFLATLGLVWGIAHIGDNS
jgi:hypothetical protein